MVGYKVKMLVTGDEEKLLTGQVLGAYGTVSFVANGAFVRLLLLLLQSDPFSTVGSSQRSSIHPLFQGTASDLTDKT